MSEKKQKTNGIAKMKQSVENDFDLKSEKRVEALIEGLFATVGEVSKKVEGDFTYFELTEAFLKVCHSYNKRALLAQFDELKKP